MARRRIRGRKRFAQGGLAVYGSGMQTIPGGDPNSTDDDWEYGPYGAHTHQYDIHRHAEYEDITSGPAQPNYLVSGKPLVEKVDSPGNYMPFDYENNPIGYGARKGPMVRRRGRGRRGGPGPINPKECYTNHDCHPGQVCRRGQCIGGTNPSPGYYTGTPGVVDCAYDCNQHDNDIQGCTGASQAHGCEWDHGGGLGDGAFNCWCNADYNGDCCYPEVWPWRMHLPSTTMQKGGRVNTNNNRSRFSGRTQNNPKGKPRK